MMYLYAWDDYARILEKFEQEMLERYENIRNWETRRMKGYFSFIGVENDYFDII